MEKHLTFDTIMHSLCGGCANSTERVCSGYPTAFDKPGTPDSFVLLVIYITLFFSQSQDKKADLCNVTNLLFVLCEKLIMLRFGIKLLFQYRF